MIQALDFEKSPLSVRSNPSRKQPRNNAWRTVVSLAGDVVPGNSNSRLKGIVPWVRQSIRLSPTNTRIAEQRSNADVLDKFAVKDNAAADRLLAHNYVRPKWVTGWGRRPRSHVHLGSFTERAQKSLPVIVTCHRTSTQTRRVVKFQGFTQLLLRLPPAPLNPATPYDVFCRTKVQTAHPFKT